jgi:hypothetical protein
MASPSPTAVPQPVDRNQGVLDPDVRLDVVGTALAVRLASPQRGLVVWNQQQKAVPLPPAMSKQDESALEYPLAEHPRAELRREPGVADVGIRLGARQGRSVSARRGLSERQGQFLALQ